MRQNYIKSLKVDEQHYLGKERTYSTLETALHTVGEGGGQEGIWPPNCRKPGLKIHYDLTWEFTGAAAEKKKLYCAV